jgi:hypothetical protein
MPHGRKCHVFWKRTGVLHLLGLFACVNRYAVWVARANRPIPEA